MRILAIDTAGDQGSVALLEENRLRAEYRFSHGVRLTGASLASVKFLLKECGWRLDEIDLFAADIGPGNFTGVKVGVQMIKTFAHALNRPTVGVGSMEALAHGHALAPGTVLAAALPARKEEIYLQLFGLEAGDSQPEAVMVEEAPDKLAGLNLGMLVGEGFHRYSALAAHFPTAPLAAKRFPSAADVGRIAFARGATGDAFHLLPNYVKPPSISTPKKPFPTSRG